MAETDVVQSLLADLGKLSPHRRAALAVLSTIQDDSSSAAEIAHAASSDPVLVARIMRMANSSYYGLRGEVRQLHLAVSLLGVLTLRGLAASALVQAAEEGGSELDHSVRCAVAAGMIAPRYGAEPGIAFCIGMVHDLGAVLLRNDDEVACEGIRERAQLDDQLLVELERLHWGVDHAELGAEALRRWDFPEEIWRTVASHHDPLAPPKPLLAALRAADCLSDLAEQPLGPDDLEAVMDVQPCLLPSGMTAVDAANAIATIRGEIERLGRY